MDKEIFPWKEEEEEMELDVEIKKKGGEEGMNVIKWVF